MNKKSSKYISLIGCIFLLIFLTGMPMSCAGQDDYEDETDDETPQSHMYIIAGIIGGLIAIMVISYFFPDGIGSRRIEYRATRENIILRRKLEENERKLEQQRRDIYSLNKPIEELQDRVHEEMENKYTKRLNAAKQEIKKLQQDIEIYIKEIQQKEEHLQGLEKELQQSEREDAGIHNLKNALHQEKQLRGAAENKISKLEHHHDQVVNRIFQQMKECVMENSNLNRRIESLRERNGLLRSVLDAMKQPVVINWLIPGKKFRYVHTGENEQFGFSDDIGILEIPEGTDLFNPIGFGEDEADEYNFEVFSNGFKLLTGIAQAVRDDLIRQKERDRKEQIEIEQMKLAQAAKHRMKATEEEIKVWACLQAGAPAKLSYSEISILTGRKKGTIQAYVNQYRKQHKDNMENTTK